MKRSLYRQVLQNEFEKMSPVLQKLHSATGDVKANGTVSMEYGKGSIIKLLNRLMGLPPEGKNIKMELQIRKNNESEIWIRKFNGFELRTEQFKYKDQLIEKFGVFTLGLNLLVINGSLQFRQNFVRMFRWRLPQAMSVNATASATEEENTWLLNVESNVFLLGLMFRYSGKIKLEQ